MLDRGEAVVRDRAAEDPLEATEPKSTVRTVLILCRPAARVNDAGDSVAAVVLKGRGDVQRGVQRREASGEVAGVGSPQATVLYGAQLAVGVVGVAGLATVAGDRGGQAGDGREADGAGVPRAGRV